MTDCRCDTGKITEKALKLFKKDKRTGLRNVLVCFSTNESEYDETEFEVKDAGELKELFKTFCNESGFLYADVDRLVQAV